MASQIQSIIVAADGSDSSDRAIDAAALSAKSAGARLTIVTVATPVAERIRREFQRIEGETSAPAEAAGQIIRRSAASWVGGHQGQDNPAVGRPRRGAHQRNHERED